MYYHRHIYMFVYLLMVFLGRNNCFDDGFLDYTFLKSKEHLLVSFINSTW